MSLVLPDSPARTGPTAAARAPAPDRGADGPAALAPEVVATTAPMAALALAVQAELLSHPRLADGAAAALRLLAQRLQADAAWLALADRGAELELVAASDGSDPAAPTPRRSHRLAASGEAFDQGLAVAWPPPLAAEGHVPPPAEAAWPPLSLAHQALAAHEGEAAVLGLPLVHQGRAIGALGLSREGARPFDAATVQALEHLSCLAGPLLALLRARERPWPQRLRQAWADWLAADEVPWQAPLRRAAPGALLVLLAVLLWPVSLPVAGTARLEGEVQRVLSAPADGYVQQVHARPGEAVRAGQPLIDLADRELQLERQRWQSQLAQHLDALAAAQARSDRGQLVQLQSRADEAQAQLELIDEKLTRSRLVAPFDGIVVQGDLSQQLGAPVALGAALMTIAPRDRYRVVVEVDERDIARVQLGQTGRLALSALPWDTLPLRVDRISPVAAPVDGRNVFAVEASLLEPPREGLRPGLQGSAQLQTAAAPTLWRWTRRAVESLRLIAWRWFG